MSGKKFLKVQDNRTIEVALQMHNALKNNSWNDE
jgi:hypothetical protein